VPDGPLPIVTGTEDSQGPVTTIVTRRGRTGRRVDDEDWLRRFIAEARRLDGFMGADVQRPVDTDEHPIYRACSASPRSADTRRIAGWIYPSTITKH
jgi:antibiotic biosynthesis monooxygenase (ABM) superfamily enzyme